LSKKKHVRKMDSLGRIRLPKKIIKDLKIKKDEYMEFDIEGKTILTRKYAPRCLFCDSTRVLIYYKNAVVCKKCALDIVAILNQPMTD
jgi:AbrB family transcriptional regulator, transcriptional pleiotropic regulator of transition state genes